LIIPPALLFAAKLSLVAASVWLASLVARRFGHRAGGVLAGMPMIAAPITGLLLIDVPSPAVRAVCLATLACQPALMAYFVAFARAAARWPWWACLVFALAVFFAVGALLLALPLPEPVRIALALSSPFLGALAMPHYATAVPAAAAGGKASQPRVELALRSGVAVAVAAGVMWGATHLGPGPAGLLLAMPITGIVLPAFTLPRHGAAAAATLLAGFVRGQAGFVIFFVLMLALLPSLHAAVGWPLAMLASGLLPWLWLRLRRPSAG